jgi:D-inositol-3-phosphate glycosyltransferase
MPRDIKAVSRLAVVSYHSSPLHEPGSGDAGGMTVYVRQVARSLAARGVHTDIFTRAAGPADRVTSLESGVRVTPVEAGPREEVPKENLPYFIEEFSDGVRAFAAMQRIRYDIVHSHYWQSGLAAVRLASTWGVPLVHSHHTLGRVKNAALPPGDTPEPSSRLAGEAEVIAAASVLVASTEAEYQQLACLYGALHDKVKVIPPGVDHGVFHPGDAGNVRAELGIGDRSVLLFVGRIQPLKGIELAIRATEQLRHALDRSPVLLVVGGSSGQTGDRELGRLEALVGSLQLEDHVRFLGPQPHDRLPDFYNASDVVVVSSHSESFGLAALEAHACGRPVVGTPVGGLSHIVSNGVSGFLADDRDPSVFAAKLKTILSDPGLARSFSLEAERVSAGFSWDGAATTFLELYECLVNERLPNELCTC